MANCVLCSTETTFMNASVGTLSDGGSVCRNCFKKISKLKPSINIKKYSLEDINNLLTGKEVEKTTADQSDTPKMDSKLIFNLIKAVIAITLIVWGAKNLFS